MCQFFSDQRSTTGTKDILATGETYPTSEEVQGSATDKGESGSSFSSRVYVVPIMMRHLYRRKMCNAPRFADLRMQTARARCFEAAFVAHFSLSQYWFLVRRLCSTAEEFSNHLSLHGLRKASHSFLQAESYGFLSGGRVHKLASCAFRSVGERFFYGLCLAQGCFLFFGCATSFFGKTVTRNRKSCWPVSC